MAIHVLDVEPEVAACTILLETGCGVSPLSEVIGRMDVLSDPLATLVVGLLSLIGAALGAWATHANHRNAQAIAQLKLLHEVSAGRQDRFDRSAEGLSSASLNVRLAAVSSLAQLADEWQKDGNIGQRDAAVKQLCFYLRRKPDQGEVAEHEAPYDEEVRRAIISAISDHNRADAKLRWPETLTDLKGAFLVDVGMRGAHITGVDLREAKLARADLKGADLSGADLRAADLGRAYLRHAKMRDVDLRGAHLPDTDLREADLTGADVSGVDLSRTDRRGALGLQ